jgi:AcrR family transcriptional regulator
MARTPTAAATVPTRQETPKGEATRLRIRTEACRLFHDQGFRATTMREITNAAGLTPAGFYNHYASKDEVLLAIIVDAFTKLDEAVNAAIAEGGEDATARLTTLVRTMTVWHCKNIQQAQVAGREAQELEDSMLVTVRNHRRRLRSLAEDIVTSGVASGEFVLPDAPIDATARVLATAVLDLVRDISGWYLNRKVLTPAQLADLLVELVLRMVGAQPPAETRAKNGRARTPTKARR